MRLRLIIVLIVTHFLFLNHLIAQVSGLSFKHITRDHGLASNKVLCIMQDKVGFMWFGTEDGLARYDGYQFQVYKSIPGDNNSLGDNIINCIVEEPETGNLWVGTTRGINYFNRKENKFYRNALQLPPNDNFLFTVSIKKVLIDHFGRLWICTGYGTYCYEKKGALPVVYRIDSGNIPTSSTLTIFEDSKNAIWAGTRRELCKFDPVKKAFVPYNLKVKNTQILDIYEDSRKNLWISSRDSGLFIISPKGIERFTKQNGLLFQNRVSATIEDANGNIWIAVRDGGGVHCWDPVAKRMSVFSHDLSNPYGINSNALVSIFKDRNGCIWIGTFANGLNYYDRYQKKFDLYRASIKSTDIFNNNIRSAFQDLQGNIWIGTRDGGGLSKFIPATRSFVNYKYSPGNPLGLNDEYVFCMADLDAGHLFVGTYRRGVSIFDKRAGTFHPVKDHPEDTNKLSRQAVYHLTKDRYDSIWCSGPEQVYVFDAQKRTFKPRFALSNIKNMLDYSRDELYFISAGSGMYCYNRAKNKIIHYRSISDSAGLNSNYVYAIAPDSKGNIWLATIGGGINVFNPRSGKFKAYTVNDGLSNNIVCGLLIDKSDNVWASTANGLVRFNPRSGRFRVFDVSDGLQGNEFDKQVYYQAKTGEMIFGGSNGFNYFHPDSIKENPIVPEVVVTDFKIFNKPVPIGDDSPLSQHIMFTKDITLTHKQSFVTFEFVALNFSSPAKNKYAYKLEGLEDDWVEAGNNRIATYSNLPAGRYIFRVKASNNDGVWNNTGASIRITVLPPWWETWWFITLVIISIIAATVSYFYYRTRLLRFQKQRLELIVKERTKLVTEQRDQLMKLNNKLKDVNRLKLQFFTNVSHEFRTPLTLILGPVDKILSVWTKKDEVFNYLLLIKRNTSRLLNLINELMDFRSIESSKIELQLSTNDIDKFTLNIADVFKELAERRHIKYEIFGCGPVKALFDAGKFEKVIYNLISNAFKYTPSGGSIQVYSGISRTQGKTGPLKNGIMIGKLIPNCNYYGIKIKDSGIGIDAEHLTDIFGEFYRVPTAGIYAIGNGLGLATAKEFVKMHKGVIIVESDKNQGSVFEVRIPLDPKLFDEQMKTQESDYNLTYSKNQIHTFLDEEHAILTEMAAGADEKSKKPLILIVEDNQDLRNFLVHQFSPNFKVLKALNGSEALKQAVKYTPDLIISDVMMPVMDGIELCKQLKSKLQTSHIPVVLLTAKSDVESQLLGLETGADDYIPKPFDIGVLQAKVSNILQSREKLRQLFSASAEVVPAKITSSSQDENFLQKALDIVQTNISNPEFGVSDLVDQMCVSRSLLHKKLVGLTNQSAMDFITTIRLKKALEFMNTTSLTIQDIALKVGFSDPKYFSRCFKKHFGTPPKTFTDQLNSSDK